MKGRRLRSGERQGEEGRGGGQRGRETRGRVGGKGEGVISAVAGGGKGGG